ncbi:5'-nucleotidase C-terminal domain-containing protein [Paenibacillus filicis]|uniref:5'-nucleotidase C-terminal domain-containing protein n=1 Tax=Paenibacillus filicis TaxID=669464 RepID=A0ABU9DH31_9BACL
MSTKTILIIGINDFHAELFETGYALGSAKLCTLVEEWRSGTPDTIVVFGGDNYRGDPVSEELSGEPVTELMKQLGAKVSAVGNHEFDYGLDTMRDWSQKGEFTFVAANVRDRRSGRIADGFQPYVILAAAGANIAFIGLSTMEDLSGHPGLSPDDRFLEITDGAVAARTWVDYLNSGADPRGKPDVIVALTHFGLKYSADRTALVGEEAMELCRQVPELAGVFTAHWHQFISAELHQVPVVQGGSHGRGFATLTIELTSDNRMLKVTPGFVDASSIVSQVPPDPSMQGKLDDYKQRTMHTLDAVIGRIEEEIIHKSPITAEVDLEGTPLTKLSTHVMCEATSCRITLMYSGRLGPGLLPGALTVYQLRKLFYFNDEIITMKLKGADLIRNVENGISTLSVERASPIAAHGLQVTADYGKPYGSRIESIVLDNGEPLEPDQYYEIAVDEFLASSKLGYDFSAGIDRKHTGQFLRDSVIQTIKLCGGLANELPGTIQVKNKRR